MLKEIKFRLIFFFKQDVGKKRTVEVAFRWKIPVNILIFIARTF